MLLFLYVTEEAGRKYVRDMPWPPAAECNMITNKQTNQFFRYSSAMLATERCGYANEAKDGFSCSRQSNGVSGDKGRDI